jgi:DNA repair exonuclease SbcCD nuclease subunit
MTAMEDQDVALKLLHTADWHLGMRFPAFDEADQLKLTRARLDVIDSLLGLAETYDVNAVVCAGDLFDDPNPAREWWKGLAERLHKRRWTTRPVFLLPGNHDPLTSNSVYAPDHPFRRALPTWTHVVDRPDYVFELNELAVLYGAPCTSTAGSNDLALSLPDRDEGDDRIRIGLVHGQTFDIDGCQMNFPIAKDAASKRGLDYLAIGDTHSFREVPPGAKVPTVYPSAPEQTKFDEDDAGFAAVVYFPRKRGRRPTIRKERVGRWLWCVEHCNTMDELRALRGRDDLSNAVVRLTARLKVSVREADEAESILKELKGTVASHGRIGVLHVDDWDVEIDTTDVGQLAEQLPPVLASVVEMLREKEAAEAELARRALLHLYRLVRQG